MVFKTRVGITFYIMLIFTFSAMVFLVSVVFLAEYIWIKVLFGVIGGILAAVIIFHMIPMITNTYYKLDDDKLLIKTGRKKIEIPYTSIISYKSGVKSMLMQPALSFNNRMEIKYKASGGITDILHISPVKRVEFEKLLESRI